VKDIRNTGSYESFDLNAIPLDDAPTYDLLKRADTAAVFQLESRGMKDMLVRAKPDRFEDIIALVALYRPGPMELIPEFCDRKQGKRIDYPDRRVEPILAETYGIMVYQEQVMQMAQILGGYSLGAADLLRRAMGKKKPEEMAQHREIFRAGAKQNGLTETKADEIFDLMEKFAGYGFNKSHAAAYALLAYQTAYLKTHFPAEFMAANMSASMDDTDKVQLLHEDSVANGIKILPPDIDQSEYRFAPIDGRTIRYGLGGVKGTGEAAIAHIVRERRERGAYRDLFDFCERVDKRIVNRRAVESLIRSGAFDALNANRHQMLASVGLALEAAEQQGRHATQGSLFGGEEQGGAKHVQLVRAQAWDERERLQNEKLALGFYLSGHPFTTYRAELAGIIKQTLADLRPQFETVLLAGVVHSVRTMQTRRGRMSVVVLDDGTAKLEVAIFNEAWEKHRAFIKEDQVLVVQGKIAEDNYTGNVRVTADQLYDLASARAAFARELRIDLNGQADARRLAEILKPHMPGNCPVTIAYQNQHAACELEFGTANLDDLLVASLTQWLSPANVSVRY
jgi:DNA polymerase III subunit alpha